MKWSKRLSYFRCCSLYLLALLAITLHCAFGTAEVPETSIAANASDNPSATPDLSSGEDAEQPETTAFDLYLGDTLMGVVVANYTSTWAEILDPNDAVEQLKGVRDPDAFKELLSGRIEGGRGKGGTGEVVADLNTFRLVVKPEADQLMAKQLTLKDRLPGATAGASLQQLFGVATSGQLDSLDSRSLRHLTVFGYGPYRMRYDGTLLQGQPHEVSDLSVGGVIDTFEGLGGLLRSQGGDFVGSVDYLGVKFGTSSNVFLDQDAMRGSRLEIFVPSRARVEFYRSGRLLAAQILDFGLQEVNTAAFPQGSYDVDIVITDNTGHVTRDRRPFTKLGLLAVRSRPTYQFDLGVLRDQLSFADRPFGHFDITSRILDSSQLSLGITGTESTLLGELSTTTAYLGFISRLGFTYSDLGSAGVASSLSGQFWEWMDWNVSYNQALGRSDAELIKEDVDDLTDPERGDNFGQIARSNVLDRTLLGTRSFSAYTGFRYNDWSFRLQGNLNERGEEFSQSTYGPQIDWNIFSESGKFLKLTSSLLSTDNGPRADITLSYQTVLDNWTASVQGNIREEGASSQQLTSGRATYDKRTPSGKGDRYVVASEARRTASSQSDVALNTDLSVAHSNTYFAVDGFLRNASTGTNSTTTVGLNGQSSFVITPEGVSVNRPAQSEGVIVVETRGSGSESSVEVLVNGQAFDTIKIGQRAVIGVAPYRTYKVGIRPTAQSDLLGFDAEQKVITVYPGNVIYQTWYIDKVVVVLGRLVNSDGAPIPWTRIKGAKEYIVTEADGSFQAEITRSSTLKVENKDNSCTVRMQIPDDTEFLFEAGDVVCLPEKH